MEKVVEGKLYIFFVGSARGCLLNPVIKPFGTTVKKASKKVVESNF
jgi:hypothetical protein